MMECCEATLDSEGYHVKRYLKYYRKVLENFVTPLSILDIMPDFNEEVRLSIIREKENRQKQIKLFLDELEKSANPIILQSFLDALNNIEDQRFLYQVLNGELSDEEFQKFFQHVENLPGIKKLFRLILPALNVIDAEECIFALEPYLGKDDRDVLSAHCRNFGNKYTIWWIFSFLQTKDPSWIKEFRIFVEARNYSNSTHGTLAKLLLDYFDFDDVPADDGQTTSHLEGEQMDEDTDIGEMTVSTAYRDGSGEVNVESKNINVQTSVGSGGSSVNAASADVRKQTTAANQTRFRIRDYQRELSKMAMEGKNVIICAPPGSGKTFVASLIIQNYFEKHGKELKKVLLFTPGGTLAEQQKKCLQEYLPDDYLIGYLHGSDKNNNFMKLKNMHIIVLTPQMLIDELDKKTKLKTFKNIDEFGLLVFDECHNCHKALPYAKVMGRYFSLKETSSSTTGLPQIVGLTATPGVGKNPNDALNCLKQLCSTFDATGGIVTVCEKKNKEELEKYVPRPKKEIVNSKRRDKNEFYSVLIGLFNFVKGQLEKTDFSSIPAYDIDDEVSYMNFQGSCTNRKREIAVTNTASSRYAYTCLEYFEKCGKALDYFNKLQPKDVYEYLNNFVENEVSVDKLMERERRLYAAVQKFVERLKTMYDNPVFANPNLTSIESRIADRFLTEPKSKVMVMTKTREYAQKLQKWAMESETLKPFNLNPQLFIGTGNKTGSDVSGLTPKQQIRIMQLFRNGDSKMLVNTPESAGVGLDVPDCNLVVIYDFVQNEISMIQTAGRVRDKEGAVFTLASEETKRNENYNAIKALLMESAVEELQMEVRAQKAKFIEELLEIQKEARIKRKAYLWATAMKRQRFNDSEYKIECKKCHTFLCSSFDLRVPKGGHYININPEFKKNYELKDHQRRDLGNMGEEWKKTNKICCKECGHVFGIEAMWKHSIDLPLIKAKLIRIVSATDNNDPHLILTQWSQAPFRPDDVDLDEMEHMFDQQIESESS